ncbi:MAG TPA: LysR substrate-binding domain-containing protein, partial [Ramlibacter sp.]|nr:LysR substrate-binding domain-containing protein [Ramlibacter sp.]
LAQHNCIGYRQPGTARAMPWEFAVDGETVRQPLPFAVCCSEPEAEMQAVLQGLGIGQIDSINAAAVVRAGQLVPLLTQHVSERMGLYLYYGQRTDMPARVRRFIDFAADRLRGGEAFRLQPEELRPAARAKRR